MIGCILACLGHEAGAAAHILNGTCLKESLKWLQKYVGTICSGRDGPVFGSVQSAVEERPHEALVSGEAIREELRDTQVNVDEAVGKSTKKPKELIKKCAIMFIGDSRAGKSTCINDLLEECGDNRRAPESHDKPCTRGVRMYRVNQTSWTTPGVEEELLLLDTEGWEFSAKKRKEGALFDDCIQQAKENNVPVEVLKHRVVLVLCLGAELRSHFHDADYMNLVEKMCKRAAKWAGGGKPVLQPVVTKSDVLQNLQAVYPLERCLGDFCEKLTEKVGEIVEVRGALGICHFSVGQRTSVQELKGRLAEICTQQLQSPHILETVRDLIEDGLREYLKEWGRKGVDSEHALVRRFLWVAARHRNMRIDNLEAEPTLSWSRADDKKKQLKKQRGAALQAADDQWHADELRRRHEGQSSELKWQKARNAELERQLQDLKASRDPVPRTISGVSTASSGSGGTP